MLASRLPTFIRCRYAALVALVFFAGHAQASELGCAANGLSPAFGVDFGTALGSGETWHLIDGDPVKFAVGSGGGVAAWVCQPNGIVRQYYGETAWGSVLWLSGSPAAASPYQSWSSAGFTPVSHTRLDPWTVETVLRAGDVQIRQVISYADGDLYVKKRWEITNQGASDHADVRFLHGGDTYFGGYDSARSWWDAELSMIYVNNQDFSVSGIMGFYANPATPADHYFGGHYNTGNNYATSDGRLPDTADSAFVDAGYYLEWDRQALGAGDTWTIEAFETWTHPSPIQVLAPADQNTVADKVAVQQFKLHNLNAANSYTLDLSALNSQGWATVFPGGSTVTVNPLERVTIPVEVTVPAGVAPGTVGSTTVSFVAQSDPSLSSQASAGLSIIEPDFTITPGNVDFGTVDVGATATQTITISNAGADLEIASIGNSDGLAAPFSLVAGEDNCSNTTVANGQSCTFAVAMSSNAPATADDSFNIPIVAPVTMSHIVAVSGSARYPDADEDGIPDSVEGAPDRDSDGDGTPDFQDTDSDNDGIDDAGEGTADSDGDGKPDYIDSSSDEDGDGIPDSVEGTTDSDGDGQANAFDTDSDGDGLADADEGAGDTDADGTPDYLDSDRDNDGVPDGVEVTEGTDPGDPADAADRDGDGVPDYIETQNGTDPDDPGSFEDADGDGVPDYVETSEGTDPADPADFADADGDGAPNYSDSDDDNDGVPDAWEELGGSDPFDPADTPPDRDNDGLPDEHDVQGPDNHDSDGDGIPDGADVDVDGDGTNDFGFADTDGDGIRDGVDVDQVPGTDSDNDGIVDSADTVDNRVDSDFDFLPDGFDPDDGNVDVDGDSILDGQDADIDGDGTNDNGTDADGNGMNDLHEGQGDFDEDGTPDYLDPDNDGDGIEDVIDGMSGNDADAFVNMYDTDSDSDGIPDAVEGIGDSDGDGWRDYVDHDSDNDGISDAEEGSVDSDGDGTPDYLDTSTDEDGDGIPDIVEGTADDDRDGTPNFLDADSDGDGIGDATEDALDSDGDGTADYLDNDSDGDGMSDAAEGTGDADGDGVRDSLDTDSDDDGIPDAAEGAGDSDHDGTPDYLDTSVDEDGDGIPDVLEGALDADADGVPNFADTDSDNDGVPDRLELAPNGDADGDGILDRFDVDVTGGTDSDGDGVDDAPLADTDGDGRADLVDADQDGDGIPDFIEAGAYGFDSDGDGVDDRWDADMMGSTDANGDGLADDASPVDSDADGVTDVRDLDSDRDGVSDAAESGATGEDSDADGVDDAYDADFAGGPDADGNGITDGVGAPDTDGDRIADYLDLDSDNDSATDVVEARGLDQDENALLDAGGMLTSAPIDSDGDGEPDLRDIDANGDGVADISLTIYGALDGDGDGRVDETGDDLDGDGIADALDGEPAQRGSRTDNDQDGVPVNRDLDDDSDGIADALEGEGDADGDGAVDRLDRDSDNDGIADRVEAGLPEPSGLDADLDGVDDAYDASATGGDDADGDGIDDRFADVDSDGDGISDRLDEDSDGDGLTDSYETLKVALSGADADGDGIDDSVDIDATGGTDANGDGIDDDASRPRDFDKDGRFDFQDPDSDNDGIDDGEEDGDFNQDGIDDRFQEDPGVKTALEGGGGSTGILGLLLLAAMVCTRRMRAGRRGLAAVLLATGLAGMLQTPAAQAGESGLCRSGEGFADGCWSVGFAVTASRLDPDDSNSGWQVIDHHDSGYKLNLRYRFFERWFLELGYTDPGRAVVENRNPAIAGREPISYEVPSLVAGYLLFEPANRLNVGVKVGYAALDTDAAARVLQEQLNSAQLALGLDLQLRVTGKVLVQLEYDYFDEDARQTGLSLRYAF